MAREDGILKRGLARVHIRRGDAARGRLDWPKARSAYSRALALTPNRADIWVQLGHALKEGGDLQEAAQAYGRAASLEPDIADTHLHIGDLCKRRGDLDGAVAGYERAFRLDPTLTAVARELELLGREPPKSDAERLAEALGAISELRAITDRQSWKLSALDNGVETLRTTVETCQRSVAEQAARVQLSADFGLELSKTRGSLAKAFDRLQRLEASIAALRADEQQILGSAPTEPGAEQFDDGYPDPTPASDATP